MKIFKKDNVILRAETESKAKELELRGFVEIKEKVPKKEESKKSVKK